MRTKTILMGILIAVSALAGDVTGKWTATMQGRKGGAPREVVYNFKADGEKLTGTTTGMGGAEVQLSDGKVKGEDISFTTKVEMNGNSMVMTYKGKIAGDEIKFTQTREGSDQGREFTAKRAN